METAYRTKEDPGGFREELRALLNRYSMENGCDTPDFILAEYLVGCLDAFDVAVCRRTEWYRADTSGEQDGGDVPDDQEQG